MLTHPRQLFEHRYAALRTGKRIAIIAELNRLELCPMGKLLETGKNVFGLDTCKSYLAVPSIAIAASKRARLANWNKHTILFSGKQDSPAHVDFLPELIPFSRVHPGPLLPMSSFCSWLFGHSCTF